MSLLDVDPQRGASHRNMAEHLAGPLRDAAVVTALPLERVADSWTARLDRVSRWPLLLVELRAPLAEAGRAISLSVQAYEQDVTATFGLASARAGFSPFGDFATILDDLAIPPDAGQGLASARAGFSPFGEFAAILDDGDLPASLAATATLWFAPFSEAGTALPAWSPVTGGDATPPFSVVVHDLPDGTPIDGVIELRLVEGNLGRLLYLIGAEKARLRRQARELHELRRMSFRFDDNSAEHRRMTPALDRLGAELRVARRTDRLTWDATRRIVSTEPAEESNESYRQRLAMYRPFVRPTPGAVQRMLRDGAGLDLATVFESNTEHAMAVRLVSSPDDAPRLAFLDGVRSTYLLQPGQAVPASRLLPVERRTEYNAALARLATSFQFPAGSLIAPMLVALLDQVGRCRAALGVTRPWRVLRAQDPAGGSRYELGLGVELELPQADELDAMGRNLAAQRLAPGTDVATAALLGSLAPSSSGTDPLGRWLLTACGAATVHATAAGLYVSHTSIAGAVLDPDSVSNGYQARFEAPGDPGPNAVLWYGLSEVAAEAAARGLPRWTELSASDAATARSAAVVPLSVWLARLVATRLQTPTTAAALAATLSALAGAPAEMFTTLRLDGGFALKLRFLDPTAWSEFERLIQLFVARELGSVLPLFTSTGVLLVVGAQALPGATTLSGSERLAFHWHMIPLTGPAGVLRAEQGPRNVYTPSGQAPSLVALVAVTLSRRDRDDPRDRIPPYTARIDLPPGELIDLATYERAMNVLERIVPIGVVLDTRSLRDRHVDPEQVRRAVPLTSRARDFRTFQLDRRPGVASDEPTP